RLRGRVPERVGDAVRGGQGLPVRADAAGPARAREARARHARGDGRRGLRPLHERIRVRGRLPEGDQGVKYRPPEQGIPAGKFDFRINILTLRLNEDFGVSPSKMDALKERILRLGIDLAKVEETFSRGGGKGGQKINKTSNRVQLACAPLDLRVACQRERKR